MKELGKEITIYLLMAIIGMCIGGCLQKCTTDQRKVALAKSVESFPDHSELKTEYLKP